MDAGRLLDVGLRIGLVGTYPPRPCGLATFTADVDAALRGAGHRVEVVALVDADAEPVDDGARYRLVRNDVESSQAVAAALSATCDVVLIEHEFGIFGGCDGAALHQLTDRLGVPYAMTLHTVTGRFTSTQLEALTGPLLGSKAALVFSDEAAELIGAAIPAIAGRCHVIPHGAPTQLYTPHDGACAALGISDSTALITTFGLLSPGKGIEHAIAAVAALGSVVDDVVYVVAGRTHPGVVRQQGEQYRDQLCVEVRQLGLDGIVRFRDWFHEVDELAMLLAATDVFVTPYGDAEQIVSGALSFAIAAGVPFVSTAYRYAREMAGRGCGLVVPFADPDRLAGALKEILTDRDLHRDLASAARRVGAGMSWPEVGRRTADVLAGIA